MSTPITYSSPVLVGGNTPGRPPVTTSLSGAAARRYGGDYLPLAYDLLPLSALRVLGYEDEVPGTWQDYSTGVLAGRTWGYMTNSTQIPAGKVGIPAGTLNPGLTSARLRAVPYRAYQPIKLSASNTPKTLAALLQTVLAVAGVNPPKPTLLSSGSARGSALRNLPIWYSDWTANYDLVDPTGHARAGIFSPTDRPTILGSRLLHLPSQVVVDDYPLTYSVTTGTLDLGEPLTDILLPYLIRMLGSMVAETFAYVDRTELGDALLAYIRRSILPRYSFGGYSFYRQSIAGTVPAHSTTTGLLSAGYVLDDNQWRVVKTPMGVDLATYKATRPPGASGYVLARFSLVY